MTIALHGNEDQKQRFLPRLAAGEIGAYSLSEAGAGTDAAALGCRAKLSEDGSHYIINGEKMWVTNGASADIYVLFAKDVDHPDYVRRNTVLITVFIVDSSMEGLVSERKRTNWEFVPLTPTLLPKTVKLIVDNAKGAGNDFPYCNECARQL